MKLYSKYNNYELYQGNMLDMLEVIKPNSIDSIVTDPPYGLTSITKRFGKNDSVPAKQGKDGRFARLSKGFMGKEWDGSGIEYNIDTWKKCYDVLKPGGYLLAFGGTRTYHKIASAIEEAGFEIRDCIMWIYGSGFPKSMNIGLSIDKRNGVESKVIGVKKQNGAKFKLTQELIDNGGFNDPNRKEYKIKKASNKWEGWGTCLKPAYEPIIIARKPFKGSLIDNVIKYNVGGINIDECRIGNDKRTYKGMSAKQPENAGCFRDDNWQPKDIEITVNGRFPANVILTYDENDFDEVCGGMINTKSGGVIINKSSVDTLGNRTKRSISENLKYDDSSSASRYFYCAKASKKDRDEGLDILKEGTVNDGRNKPVNNPFQRGETLRKNTHPTVKPTNLMQYLVRLVTPKGGTILDPFLGSGSTGKAVMYENLEREANYKFIGIELLEEYLDIADLRIKYACNMKKYKQLTLNIE